jgi:hypothetical protein
MGIRNCDGKTPFDLAMDNTCKAMLHHNSKHNINFKMNIF